jgi:RNA polymerase sigma-70 factor, ECF subfamily
VGEGALLLKDSGRGEGLSSQEIVRRYQRRIYSVIHRMVGNRGEVEDLCQETFLQLLRNPAGLQSARDRDAWVYRIAMNVAVDSLRRKARDRGLSDKAAVGREPVSKPPVAETETESAAVGALEQLDPHLKQVIVLRIFEGLSHEQIAAVLDAPIGTVRWRLFEARRKLAEILGPQLKDMKEGLP